MDKLKSMAAFVCIAEQNSLTAASQVLGASLADSGAHAGGAGSDLGVRLFNRSTRRIALTNEGLCCLDSCRHVLATWKAESALREDRELAGQLTITAPVLFGQMHVAPSLNRFVRQHHKVRCSLVLADRQVNLLEGHRSGRAHRPAQRFSLVAHQVGQVRRMVVAAPHLSAQGEPAHPRTCCGANCIDFSGAGHSWWAFRIMAACSLAGGWQPGVQPRRPGAGACLDGLGFGMFLSIKWRRTWRKAATTRAAERRPGGQRHLSARQAAAGRTRAFIEWIKTDLASEGCFTSAAAV